jgi:dTDP-4-dehydrorhamnose 3,5-epimerase
MGRKIRRADPYGRRPVKFLPTPLEGAYVIEPEPADDDRGCFARTYCSDEFGRRGLDSRIAQCSISYNRRRGTLRGMHYQTAPHEEAKLVRCTRGTIFDVIVDLRQASPTRKQWYAAELSVDNRKAMYVPKGFAHGFLTLTAEAEVFYQISVAYEPAFARGFRWNDPSVAIAWPQLPDIVSPRDERLPALAP